MKLIIIDIFRCQLKQNQEEKEKEKEKEAGKEQWEE